MEGLSSPLQAEEAVGYLLGGDQCRYLFFPLEVVMFHLWFGLFMLVFKTCLFACSFTSFTPLRWE